MPSAQSNPIHSAISRFVTSRPPYLHDFCLDVRPQFIRGPTNFGPAFQLCFQIKYPAGTFIDRQAAGGLYPRRLILQRNLANHHIFNHFARPGDELPNIVQTLLAPLCDRGQCKQKPLLVVLHIDTPADHLATLILYGPVFLIHIQMQAHQG